jgi:hypothetical protein
MDTWITVVVAAIVALSTLGGAFLQSWFSNKRFKIEIGRTIDIESRKRKWEVRSEPLLKLRAELAVMATKLDRLATSAHKLHTRFGPTEEEVKKELQQNVEDVNTYIASGNFNQTLFIQYDKELRDAVENIIKEYRKSYFQAINYKDLKAKELSQAMDVFKENADKILEVQELINKKLEGL